MPHCRGNNGAFGWPGLEPRWTHGNKEGVGTANSSGSRVWLTLSQGILSEIYYPTVDRPQTRELLPTREPRATDSGTQPGDRASDSSPAFAAKLVLSR